MKRSATLFVLASLAACAPEEYVGVELVATGGSGITGVAEFIDYDLKGGIENVSYWVNVTGPSLKPVEANTPSDELSARLLRGTCDNPGEFVAALSAVYVGDPDGATRNHQLDSPNSLEPLVSSPHAVVVERSGYETVACGELPDRISSRD